jgi:predicted TIM-barrel fold metal-dependent hydrolase
MLIVDAHAHLYSPDESSYPPREDPKRPPLGTGTVEHLKREMDISGVRWACAIQTSTFYAFDNRFTVEASVVNCGWMTGVCTVDPDDAKSPALLEYLIRQRNIRGMRSLPAADGRLDHPGVRALWRTARDLGIVINLLIDPPHAGEADNLLAAFPDLHVVLDHCMNLKVGADLVSTIAELRRLARRPNLFAKLSFVASGSEEGYPFRDMHQPCLDVIRAFGPERCTWGSDFPCELWIPKSSYMQHLALFLDEIDMPSTAREQVLGGTACRLWFPGAQ